MKKLITLGTTFAGLCALSYAGVAYVGGNTVEQHLTEAVNAPVKGARMTSVSHEKGWFSSEGALRLEMNPVCQGFDHKLAMSTELRYTINHAPNLQSMTTYEFTWVGLGKVGETVRQASGDDILLSGQGHRGFDGLWHTQFQTPQFQITSDTDATMLIPASSGSASGDTTKVRLDWSMPTITASKGTSELSVEGIKLNADYTDITRGLGRIGMQIGSVSGEQFRVDGIELLSKTQRNGDRLDSHTRHSVSQMQIQNKQFKNLGLTLQVNGMDEQALMELSTIKQPCGAAIDKEMMLTLERALLRLMDKGMTIAMPELTVDSDDGQFRGQMKISLEPQDDSLAMPLEDRLSADADLEASGSLVPAQQQSMLMQIGLAQASANGMRTTMSLADGTLSINGRQDATPMTGALPMLLMQADQFMAAWRQSLASDQPLLAPKGSGI